MTIHVYSKPGCGKCEAAKDKLKRMGMEYVEHELGYHVSFHEGWREDGSVEVMAAHTQLDTMPLLKIDNKFYNYSAAMKELKGHAVRVQEQAREEAVLV